MQFENSKILATHHKNGALQGLTVVTKEGLELLSGFVTIIKPSSITLKDKTNYDFSGSEEVFLEKGWYDSNLNFIKKVSNEEQLEINNLLVF